MKLDELLQKETPEYSYIKAHIACLKIILLQACRIIKDNNLKHAASGALTEFMDTGNIKSFGLPFIDFEESTDENTKL